MFSVDSNRDLHLSDQPSFFDSTCSDFIFQSSRISFDKNEDLSCATQEKFLLLCKPLDSGISIQGNFSLYKDFLIYYESESLMFGLNLSYAQMQIKNDLPQKIFLTRNQKSYELTFFDKKVLDAWIIQLNKICVRVDFDQQYQILEMKEVGKNFIVYRVQDKKSCNLFSAKVFNKESPNNLQSSVNKLNMMDEIQIMRQLDHKSILKLHQVYETENSICLITDLIHNNTLQGLLPVSKYGPSLGKFDLVEIMSSLLQVVSYLASQNILHRNLKASNILVEDGNKIKLFNFSLATIQKRRLSNVLSCEERPQIEEHEDDIFSVGCIFFQLLFGNLLLEKFDPLDIWDKNQRSFLFNIILKEIFCDKSQIDKRGLDLLLKLITKDPNQKVSADLALGHPYFEPPRHFILGCSSHRKLSQPLRKVQIGESLLLGPSVRSQQVTGERSLTSRLFPKESLLEFEKPSFYKIHEDLNLSLEDNLSLTTDTPCSSEDPSPQGKSSAVKPKFIIKSIKNIYPRAITNLKKRE